MTTTASERMFARAIEAHRKGAIEDAKSLYREVLRIDPRHVAAYGNLAIIAAQQGDLASAEKLLREEIRLKPDYAAAHNHLGLVLQQQGRPDEAVAAHRQALKHDPDYAEALLALGDVLKQQQDIEGARKSYLAAIAKKPDYAEAHNNLGVLLQMQGTYDDAASAYRKAAAARGGYAEAEFNLGTVLQQAGRLDEAVSAYQRAIAIAPKVAVAYNNMGTALKDLGRPGDAVAALERAVSLQPDYAEAFYNLASAQREQGDLEKALTCYGRAIALKPDYADALNNAGIVLQEVGRAGEAIALYRRLLSRTPDHADVHNNIGTALLSDGQAEEAKRAFTQALALRADFPEALCNLGNAWRELGGLSQAIAAYEEALRHRPDHVEAFCQLAHHRRQACQWDSFDADEARIINLVRSGARVPPFYLLPVQASAADQLACARNWVAPIARSRQTAFVHQPGTRGPRIRLGYLSGDFHQHATAHLMAELFERHDRRRFEVVAYSYGPDDASPMRTRLTQAFDRFVDIRARSHLQAASTIHEDRIDILIDLKGYTHGARPAIPAQRPAPVQVSYLGFPATIGADFIDYLMVDPHVVPADQQALFSERLVHLPGCYQVNDRKREIALDVPSKPQCGLPDAGFVFCGFNNSYKVTPQLFDLWMRLLASVPGSVLWLLRSNALVEGNLRAEAAQRGIAPGRLVFAPLVPPAGHLARLRHADLFLDTLPCNAHTTASDALWAGLPVLTCSGETFAGRVAGSLLSGAGLSELVTPSLDEYEQLALALARDPDRLTALRERLGKARDASPLFDLPALARHIEAAYDRMWQNWLAGRAPAAFAL
jgi:protein O-GlcNAc transferase